MPVHRTLCTSLLLVLSVPAAAQAAAGDCAALVDLPGLTLIRATHRQTEAQTPYCHARGIGPRAIAYHVALPDDWNGRLVYLGDGGQDGDLDLLPAVVDAGYAVVNSNMGHDSGVERQAFGFQDPDSEVDFAWRAQHLALNAGKHLVAAYYGRAQAHTYHFGCSTGGRQGLLAAQVLPDDYDGIVAGAPGHLWYSRMAHRVALMQTLFANDMAANLAIDTDGDGQRENLGKVDLLTRRALDACDGADGLPDGLIEPTLCDFDPRSALAGDLCPAGADRPDCLTPAQLEAVVQLYEGSRTSDGRIAYPGAPVGSEPQWPAVFIPHAGNAYTPYALVSGAQVIGYRFYARDPGLMPPDLANTRQQLVNSEHLPQWGWWNFDLDDLQDPDKRTPVFDLMQGDDPDLTAYLLDRGGKLLMFHGWADAVIPPRPTVDYFDAVVRETFAGDRARAAGRVRLYMIPGMAHCFGGPGPQPGYLTWLETLVRWVEDDIQPESLTGRTTRNGGIVDERPLCPYPQRAVFTGPTDAAGDPASWKAERFSCR